MVHISDIKRDTEYHLARAEAIETYAQMEAALCAVFSLLLRVDNHEGGIVFYRLTAHFRSLAVTELLERRFGEKYDQFWLGSKGTPGKPGNPGLKSHIRNLDDERNNIVHWHTVKSIDGDAMQFIEELRPGSLAAWPNKKPISREHLLAFSAKADFVAHHLRAFHFISCGATENFPPEPLAAWLQIFEQPVPYPPSDTHPLSPKNKVPGVRPLSSEE